MDLVFGYSAYVINDNDECFQIAAKLCALNILWKLCIIVLFSDGE
jgi:hypothetical protein